MRHGAWMVSGAGVRAAVAFAANLVLVRLLLPEHFGRFAIVQANISVVSAVTNLKVHDLLLREPDDELDRRRLGLYLGALAVQTAAVGFGAVGLLWIFDLLRLDATILLLSTLASYWVHAQMTLFERRFAYRPISLIETGSHAAGHLFAVGGALAGLGALVLYLRLAVQLVGKVIGLGSVGGLRRMPLRRLGMADLRRVVDKVRGFWLDGVVEQCFERIVILLVGALVGTRATGFFYQARRLAVVPHQLASPVTTRIAYNVFSHRVQPDRRRRILGRVLTWELIGLLAVAGAGLALADPIVPWLFGEDWQPVVPLFRAMMGVVVGMTMFNTLNAHFMAADRLRSFVAWGRGSQYVAVALAVGGAALAPGLGYDLGLALGLSGAYLAGTAAAWYVAAPRETYQ